MTLGALLAGAPYMVSCDGSDGSDGTNGINGNSPNIAVAAPSSDALSVSTLSLTVDSPSGDFTLGQQVFLDFDSAVVAESLVDVNNNTFRFGLSSLGVVSNFQTTSETSYTFNYLANDGSIDLENVVLEVTSSRNNSLIGSWSADGALPPTQPQIVTVAGVDNANFIIASSNGTELETDDVQGFRVTANNVPVFSFSNGASFTLTSDLEAILVDASLISTGGGTSGSFLFVRALTPDVIMEIGDTTVLNSAERFTDGVPAIFEVIAEAGDATPVSGTFEHIIQGSTSGTEQDELSNFPGTTVQ